MENQNIEWKRQWKDDILKTICAFSNSNGGLLEIGKDDNGNIVGLSDGSALLEEIPNTIRQTMGVVPSVELLSSEGKQYIIITISASSSAVSYRGKYYLRSGSTTQELNGIELQNFILRKHGKNWDATTIPQVAVSDLDTASIRKFREKAITSERLTKADLDVSDEILLDNLMLIEDGLLTRAAILLFHENPERFVFGSYVKVGYFENDADLIFQDEVHGPLITIPDKIMEIINLKYFKGLISYEDIQRVETYPIPRPALREAILNAIVHRDYTTGVPIQIKIYPNKVIIYNDGRLPENWTIEHLLSTYRSRPYNPKIANVFFRAGFIESWGRGIERITLACRTAGKPDPQFNVLGEEFKVTFDIIDTKEKLGEKLGENTKKILYLMSKELNITIPEISKKIGISETAVQNNIKKLKKLKYIERIGSDKGGHWKVNTSL